MKGEDELGGLEYHAWTGFCHKNTNWIPIGKTRYLGRLKTYNRRRRYRAAQELGFQATRIRRSYSRHDKPSRA